MSEAQYQTPKYQSVYYDIKTHFGMKFYMVHYRRNKKKKILLVMAYYFTSCLSVHII